jgi:hypothetical protein
MILQLFPFNKFFHATIWLKVAKEDGHI